MAQALTGTEVAGLEVILLLAELLEEVEEVVSEVKVIPGAEVESVTEPAVTEVGVAGSEL